ncbi:MAG: hypothetical protein HS128_04605 [Ideonella sp.]|nr:hypothetical protein [Ideonella sp.]MCC7455478.1 hypothetical protein [Nitrospira sp.]
MHGPLARTTPTRWPWSWTLLLMWFVLTSWSSAFAAPAGSSAHRAAPRAAPTIAAAHAAPPRRFMEE